MTSPYCMMCAKASRPEFNTHFLRETRDPNSKVTCPFLLAIECRYCKEKGHTKNYCPVLNDKIAKTSIKAEAKLEDEDGFVTNVSRRRGGKQSPVSVPVETSSKFGALVVEDEVVCVTAEEEYPALAGIPMDKWSAPRLLGVWADEE